MKDETHGVPIEKFVYFKLKMYSILFTEGNKPAEKKKTAHRMIWHQHYKSYLFKKQVQMARKMKRKPSTLFSDFNQDKSFTPRWWSMWKDMLMQSIDKHAPLKSKRVGNKKALWTTDNLCREMHNRDFLKKKAMLDRK